MKKIVVSVFTVVVVFLFGGNQARGSLVGDQIFGVATPGSGHPLHNTTNYFNWVVNGSIFDTTPTAATVSEPSFEFILPSDSPYTNITSIADFDGASLTIVFENMAGIPNEHINWELRFTDLNYGSEIVGLSVLYNTFPTAPTFSFK